MNKKLIVMMAALSAPLWAVDTGGAITYVEGTIELVRHGRTSAARFGSLIENFDQIRAGRRTQAEISLDGSRGVSGTIRVRPGTIFHLDVSEAEGTRRTSIELFSGSLAVAVRSLSADASLEIRTEGAVMSVRGTVFEVDSGVGGEVLVSCESGRVEVSDANGRVLFAEPGVVVERGRGEVFRTIPVAVGALAEFRRTWNAQKIEAFKASAADIIRDCAARYLELKAVFDKAYLDLLRQRDIIDKWMREERDGRIGSAADMLREKRSIVGPLMEIRAVAFPLERVYYRLIGLEGYAAQGYGRGLITGNQSTEQFFRNLRNEAVSFEERMNNSRLVMRLFARRSEGGVVGEIRVSEKSR